MTKKIFIGALVAITFAGSFAAVAATSGSFGGNSGQGGSQGGGQVSSPAASPNGGEYRLRPATHAYLPGRKHRRKRIKLNKENCGCIEAVVKNGSGDVIRRSCNKRPHYNDLLIRYQCRGNR